MQNNMSIQEYSITYQNCCIGAAGALKVYGNMQPLWENLLAGWPNMKLQPIFLKIYIMIPGAL